MSLWLCPGLACSLHSVGPLGRVRVAKGTSCPDSNLESHAAQPAFVSKAPNRAAGSPPPPDPLLSNTDGKREYKCQVHGGPVGPPAGPPASHRADSCRRSIYLRALSTVSCPGPLWRQAAKEDSADEKQQQNQPGARGLGKETQSRRADHGESRRKNWGERMKGK